MASIIIMDTDDRGSRAPAPGIALAELHVVVLGSSGSGIVGGAAPLGGVLGADGRADGEEGGEFAGAGAAAAAEGELAGDFGGEVAEEVGHGDEAAADDAGGDFGDAVSFFWVVSL